MPDQERELRDGLAITRRRYNELRADITEQRARLAQLEMDLIQRARECGTVQDCGCRPPRTMHDQDPGFECHKHWWERVAREKGWAVGSVDGR